VYDFRRWTDEQRRQVVTTRILSEIMETHGMYSWLVFDRCCDARDEWRCAAPPKGGTTNEEPNGVVPSCIIP